MAKDPVKILKLYFFFMGISLVGNSFAKIIIPEDVPGTDVLSCAIITYSFLLLYSTFFQTTRSFGARLFFTEEQHNEFKHKLKLGNISRLIFTFISIMLVICSPLILISESDFHALSVLVSFLDGAFTLFVLYYPPTRKVIDKPKSP